MKHTFFFLFIKIKQPSLSQWVLLFVLPFLLPKTDCLWWRLLFVPTLELLLLLETLLCWFSNIAAEDETISLAFNKGCETLSSNCANNPWAALALSSNRRCIVARASSLSTKCCLSSDSNASSFSRWMLYILAAALNIPLTASFNDWWHSSNAAAKLCFSILKMFWKGKAVSECK